MHKTLCELDFDENIKVGNLLNDCRRLQSILNNVHCERNLEPESMATDLAKVLDTIDTIKEHKDNIYAIFDRYDTLATSVRKLPK